MVQTGENIKLIRSPLDNNTPELEELIKKQIKLQLENNIEAKVIVTTEFPYDEKIKEKDKLGRVTRCRIPK